MNLHLDSEKMKLKQLIRGLPIQIKGAKDQLISGICTNSRLVTPGCLFIAKGGAQFQGRHYIEDAVRSGASAVLTDLYNPFLPIAQLIVAQPEVYEAQLAAKYYNSPSKDLFCVGITGTNGKTTTSFLLQHLLGQLVGPCGLIGTVHYATARQIYNAQHTTPEASLNQKLLREMVQSGCKCVAMEVSSHALDQRRTEEIDFDCAIFTNLTHEHLDYHKSLAGYTAAKRRLFNQLHVSSKPNKFAVVNADDLAGSQMLDGFSTPALTFSVRGNGDLNAYDICCDLEASHFKLHWKNQSVKCTLPLYGQHNVENALAAAAPLLLLGFSLADISAHLQTAQAPPGRLQRVENAKGLSIFVDYAHTEDALRNSLSALRLAAPTASLILVFGCGGQRDQGKRPAMGAVAAKLADYTIVTSDNPRGEDPEKICTDICAGIPRHCAYHVQYDRRDAIREAVARMNCGDLLLIAGKGHEKVQIIGGKTLPLDDVEEVRTACSQIKVVTS